MYLILTVHEASACEHRTICRDRAGTCSECPGRVEYLRHYSRPSSQSVSRQLRVIG